MMRNDDNRKVYRKWLVSFSFFPTRMHEKLQCEYVRFEKSRDTTWVGTLKTGNFIGERENAMKTMLIK